MESTSLANNDQYELESNVLSESHNIEEKH